MYSHSDISTLHCSCEGGHQLPRHCQSYRPLLFLIVNHCRFTGYPFGKEAKARALEKREAVSAVCFGAGFDGGVGVLSTFQKHSIPRCQPGEYLPLLKYPRSVHLVFLVTLPKSNLIIRQRQLLMRTLIRALLWGQEPTAENHCVACEARPRGCSQCAVCTEPGRHWEESLSTLNAAGG